MTENTEIKPAPAEPVCRFKFLKGDADIFSTVSDFDWRQSAAKTREFLGDAMNARNLSFLLGSGCSSHRVGGKEVGIPTMAPLAGEFLQLQDVDSHATLPTNKEADAIKAAFGIDITDKKYSKNLERLMEVLFTGQYLVKQSSSEVLLACSATIDTMIDKIAAFIRGKCITAMSVDESSPVTSLYQAFYRRLIFRDRNLPQPWVFTTNYDLFNEVALDRLGTPYCNGFSGTVERRFNPAVYRYSLAEQLDISNRKWTSVDGYIYLCKLHGSINWIEEGKGLFPIREATINSASSSRLMIYPTPTKQNASFGAPYSDLFREFQSRVVREQSVLVVLGYSFGDEHINNLIFQALTVPTFRLVAFVDTEIDGVVQKLRQLQDPRIWLIGGRGPDSGRKAHYFDTFVEYFMPEPPGSRVEQAIERVVAELLDRTATTVASGESREK